MLGWTARTAATPDAPVILRPRIPYSTATNRASRRSSALTCVHKHYSLLSPKWSYRANPGHRLALIFIFFFFSVALYFHPGQIYSAVLIIIHLFVHSCIVSLSFIYSFIFNGFIIINYKTWLPFFTAKLGYHSSRRAGYMVWR